MRKMLLYISRVVLIFGVLVALTPCNACQTDMGKGQMTCHMSKSGGMGCCHKGKESSPLCKTMNQASTQAVSHGLEVVSAPVVSFASSLVVTPTRVCVSCRNLVDASPHRAPLSLRI